MLYEGCMQDVMRGILVYRKEKASWGGDMNQWEC